MNKHISYPSTEQFVHVIQAVNRQYTFVGLDAEGKAIYDNTKPKPIISFTGTVKLHGTAFYVCQNATNGIWFQSREKVITPEKDNAGSAFFGTMKKEVLREIIEQVRTCYNIPDDETVMLCSEWAGGNVQKGVGISNIEKSMFIYAIKISKPEDENFVSYYVDYEGFRSIENKIYNMLDFKTYNINVDFNCPMLMQNKIIELTLDVEARCPVSDWFTPEVENLIGEGIVFTNLDREGNRLMFKSKGDKHAGKSKVKTLKVVDDVKLKAALDLADRVTPVWRLAQMLEKTFDFMNGAKLNRSKMGEFIKNVIADVVKEETLAFQEANLELKDVAKYIQEEAKKYFFQAETGSLI